jgi:hypothetical protein
MKDQGMPLGDFRFCFPYEPCSQELKARLAGRYNTISALTRLYRVSHRSGCSPLATARGVFVTRGSIALVDRGQKRGDERPATA